MLDTLFLDGKPTALQAGDTIALAIEKDLNRPTTFTVFRKSENRFLVNGQGQGKFSTLKVVKNQGDFTEIMTIVSFLCNLQFKLTMEESKWYKKIFYEFF